MKILVVADSPNIKTGFSRVSEQICCRLSKAGHEIVMLGINDPGTKHHYPFFIYPAFSTQGQDLMGFARLPYVIEEEKPELVLLFNDVWVCERYYKVIEEKHKAGAFKVFCYAPIDSEGYIKPMVEWLDNLDGVATYTQFGLNVLKNAGVTKEIAVFPHGVDSKTFFPIDKLKARKQIFQDFPDDAFIVLNANRNQPRKQIDLTIKAFCKFAKDKDNVWLYLHMGSKDVGWDVIPLFRREMEKVGRKPDNLILTSSSPNISAVSESELNLIYNSANVCVNTSQGEGFSLTNAESSMCGVSQIVPNYSACAELWGEGRGLLTNVQEFVTDRDLFLERAIVSTKHLSSQLEYLYNNAERSQAIAIKGQAYFKQPQFQWKSIVQNMEKWLIT